MTSIIQKDWRAVDEMIVSKGELVARTSVVNVDGARVAYRLHGRGSRGCAGKWHSRPGCALGAGDRRAPQTADCDQSRLLRLRRHDGRWQCTLLAETCAPGEGS